MRQQRGVVSILMMRNKELADGICNLFRLFNEAAQADY